ncbi:hypothetical protein EJ06DRAFT_373444 [Trichodelitschia bisporula]|uniref:Uncharacterized protein n=1 Tax=Trichodelitschia bisporula TaxID=703511 RepID=A0A6G1I1F0_9PEZI|nr:hypothetical protein EJ06DRAFT_373444 [Trichodelitschia bisporula]
MLPGFFEFWTELCETVDSFPWLGFEYRGLPANYYVSLQHSDVRLPGPAFEKLSTRAAEGPDTPHPQLASASPPWQAYHTPRSRYSPPHRSSPVAPRYSITYRASALSPQASKRTARISPIEGVIIRFFDGEMGRKGRRDRGEVQLDEAGKDRGEAAAIDPFRSPVSPFGYSLPRSGSDGSIRFPSPLFNPPSPCH